MATPSAIPAPLTGDLVIDTMTTGFKWNTSSPIGYSFSDGFEGEVWLNPLYVRSQIDLIFSVFDYYVGAAFAYKGYWADPAMASLAGSNINLTLDSVYISEGLGNNVLAIGIFPNTSFAQGILGDIYYPGAEGDIFLNINSPANMYGYEPGNAGFSLALHEIGHALGLKHPHDHGGSNRPTFLEAGMEGLDIDWMTVMSYDDDYDWNTNGWDPATPMILDVIALQYLYGPNLATNSGDSIYRTFDTGTYYRTIFDASGHDTIDLSIFPTGAYIEMPHYVVSDYQHAPFGWVTDLNGGLAMLEGNSPEALTWVLGYIEEVTGSAFSDVIIGSDQSDIIRGGNGNDQIVGGIGNDKIDGGAGIDTVRFQQRFEDCTISFEGATCIVSTPGEGTDSLTAVETVIFSFNGQIVQRSVSELSQPPVPSLAAPQMKMITSSGFVGKVGGNASILGTAGFQEIAISAAPGSVSLDPTFNRGGDIVQLPGPASIWSVGRSGSSAVFSDGDTIVQIPVGTAGMPVMFEDGPRLLKFDSAAGSMTIGSQSFANSMVNITSPPAGALPEGSDQGASARLYLASGAGAEIAGRIAVLGTGAAERVTTTDGHIQLDPSFNKGGDHLFIAAAASTFTATRQGSSVLLDGANLEVLIPVGTTGMTIEFAGGDDRVLLFDPSTGGIRLADQVIGTTPVSLIAFG